MKVKKIMLKIIAAFYFYYREQAHGRLKTDQVKRLKELKLENARLRPAVLDLTLDKLIGLRSATAETA